MAKFYKPELDVVRFLAFSAVFLHHCTNHGVPGDPLTVGSTISNAFSFGLCLFFTLSAYLITELLWRERDRTGTVKIGAFFKRRILRIWPLYLLAIAGAALWSWHVGSLRHDRVWLLAALVMSGNLVDWTGVMMNHLWSISIEEQFYLFFPSVAKWCTRRAMASVAFGLLLLSNATLVRFGLLHADTDERIWGNTFVQFQFFGFGILLALWIRGRASVVPSPWIRPLLLTSVPILWFVASSLCHIKWRGPATGPIVLCVGYALVALSCCALIAGLLGISSWPHWIVYLGRISYGLYVFHMPYLKIFLRHPPAPDHTFGAQAYKLVPLGLTILTAMLSYRFFEVPFLRLKNEYDPLLQQERRRPKKGVSVENEEQKSRTEMLDQAIYR